MPDTTISTLGALKASGYTPCSVKQEIRKNLITRLHNGDPVFTGILGYDRTVIPQLQNALLAKHDIILLGLRGQGKSRIIRALSSLLDEWIPAIDGSDLQENPFHPVTKYGRDLIEEKGDETPIIWIHRSDRYSEKLATPDTSIADLIGDIDPIKAATRRLTYADEEVIHFGLLPRANRGIFAINELPDLQPRIQVGLLNIMEEQDIQIRGFNIRIPLDVMLVFSANPEDYTNRGSIITPLKDRIDSQILTHYPKTLDIGIEITRQEAWQDRDGGIHVHIPFYFRQIIEQIAVIARNSEYIDQKSGVSVRLTRSALEALISAAERRSILSGEPETCLRITDLLHIEQAVTGKIELVYEGEQEGAQNVARSIIGRACKEIFAEYFPDPSAKKDKEGKSPYRAIIEWFTGGKSLTLDQEMSTKAYKKALDSVSGLKDLVLKHTQPETEGDLYSSMEWVLESLHQTSLIGKDYLDSRASYNDIMGSMLSGLGDLDEDDMEDFERYN